MNFPLESTVLFHEALPRELPAFEGYGHRYGNRHANLRALRERWQDAAAPIPAEDLPGPLPLAACA